MKYGDGHQAGKLVMDALAQAGEFEQDELKLVYAQVTLLFKDTDGQIVPIERSWLADGFPPEE